VESVGWHGSQYVLPQRVYGQSKGEHLVLQSRHTVIPNFARQGTLVEWQQAIGQYAVGNSRLAFVISAALASVCLHLMREDNIAFHFAGASSIGKSTLLHCAASVMGAPLYSWRTTDNALEGIAAMSNDNVLLLDELGQIDGKAAASIAYMLGNGQAKTRANKYGATRPIQHFRNLVLSSGEIGLAHKLAENDRQQRAGEMVRFIELPADAGQQLGLFETLHGYPDSRSLADHLRTAAGHYQGMIMDAFLVMLTHDDRPAIINTLKKLQEKWAAHHIPHEANGQVARVGRKFALVAAVGELANSAGILNWPDNTASHAVATLFAAWQQEQHGQDSFEVSKTAAALQHFIATHGNSRFEQLHDDDAGEQKIINRAGFRRKKDGITEYLLFPEVFAKEICVAGDAKAVARQLAQKGIIQKCRSGTTSQALRLPSLGNRRVYVIPITTLEGSIDHA
jgi:putative DNA primase/helicase